MPGLGMPSPRTLALEAFHRKGWSIDRIASHLDVSQEKVTGWVYGTKRKPLARSAGKRRRQSISTTSRAQREKCREAACVVCRKPADHSSHLIDKGQAADHGDSRAVVPMCSHHHTAYDEGDFDLLPFLEPHHRTELAFAVERFGLISTLQRITGSRWQPANEEER